MASKDKISQFPLSNQHAQRSKQADLNTVGQSLLGKGEVALVGAGPGDVELRTLKALRFRQHADVALKDDLGSDALNP